MRKHLLHIKQQFLDYIISGQKTLEIRVAYPRLKAIKVGDIVLFNGVYAAPVIAIRRYNNFEELLDHESAERICPGKRKGEVLKLLQEIYPPEKEKLGILAIKLGKLCNSMWCEKWSRLLTLYREFDSCAYCAKPNLETDSSLKHVWGIGQVEYPRLMLVLMSPTGRNITLQPTYLGKLRMPYAGVRSFWHVLTRAGIISSDTLKKISWTRWNDTSTCLIIDALSHADVFLTELVKCPSNRAIIPSKALLQHNLLWFKKEIGIIRPKAIVAFGLWVFRALTGHSLRLRDYFETLQQGKPLAFPLLHRPKDFTCPVYPCYFPTGRGDKSRAIECLQIYNQMTWKGGNVSE